MSPLKVSIEHPLPSPRWRKISRGENGGGLDAAVCFPFFPFFSLLMKGCAVAEDSVGKGGKMRNY